ncbi:MAG: hypothetical protein ACREGF_00635 [Candidatus Saccharimonadales bacterium]
MLVQEMNNPPKLPTIGCIEPDFVQASSRDTGEAGMPEVDPIDEIVKGVDPSELDDDKLADLVEQHPAVNGLLSELLARRVTGIRQQEEREHMDRLSAARIEIGNQIKLKLGLKVENPKESARQKELERLQALGKVLMSLTGEESEDDLLQKYGLVDDEGVMNPDSISSPLFHQETKRAFASYLRYVEQFDALQEAEMASGARLRGIDKANNLRSEAHDAVAKLVMQDIGLPFDAARRFVAKMREARVPGSQEKMSYGAILRVGGKLSERCGHDAAAFTEEALRDLIDKPMDHEQ